MAVKMASADLQRCSIFTNAQLWHDLCWCGIEFSVKCCCKNQGAWWNLYRQNGMGCHQYLQPKPCLLHKGPSCSGLLYTISDMFSLDLTHWLLWLKC